MHDDFPEILRLGIPEVDLEHVLQVQILGAISNALLEGDRDQARKLIRQLQDVTAAHFIAEQLLMRLHSYPGHQTHEREHDRLIEELQHLEGRIAAGEHDAPETTREFEKWLVHHILTADKAFGAYLLDRESERSKSPMPS
jgi:hemerythrin